jgi:perosamine synthetase
MNVPMSAPSLGGAEVTAVRTAVREGWVSSRGRFLTQFEREFSRYVGARYGVSTTSGTTALHLALATLRIGPGDEVILPDSTMVACLDAVLYTGASPVLVDIDPDTWTIDLEAVAKALTRRTRAVMPVHLYGHPVDMDPLLRLAAEHRISVVEDAAEAHGARYRGRPVGCLGALGCFSFYSNKILTTGEGGMVVTRDRALRDRAVRLRDLAFAGEARDYRHTEVGFNYRMTNVQAALGVAQMRRVERFVRHRRACAQVYREILEGTPGLVLPTERPWAKNVYWMYTVLVEGGERERERLMRRLRRKGVESRVAFWPLHRQPFAPSRPARASDCPNADRLGRCGLSLPSGNGISLAMVRHAARAVREAL